MNLAPIIARSRSSLHERFLRWIGVDPQLIEAVSGDLAEDYAEHATRYGALVAWLRHVADIMRSMPHFIASAYARGDVRTRRRIAAFLGAVGATSTLVAGALIVLTAGPSRIVATVADATDGVVINSLHATRLPIYVYDRFGRKLGGSNVKYQWIGGEPVAIAPDGSATCTRSADAVVRAQVGDLSTEVAVRCRPVNELQASSWVDLIAGDAPRQLPFVALDADHRMVTMLRGTARVTDSAVARLHGTLIRPVAPGRATVVLDVGDRRAKMEVVVHHLVQSFTARGTDQRFAAVAVLLAQGDTARYSLPVNAAFWLKYIPINPDQSPPTIWLDGRAVCVQSDGIRSYTIPREEVGLYCTTDGGADVVLAHGRTGARFVAGHVAVERVDFR